MLRCAALRATLLAPALALSACAPSRSAPASAPPPLEVPVLTVADSLGETVGMIASRVQPPKRDLLGSVAYDLPVQANSWVEAELDFLVEQRREVIARWMERGDHYEPFIKSVLRAHHVPTDLYHLGMIESAFVPTARSRAGAVGLWQFMPATGRAMGLRVDSLVDERMDPVRSTRAAARHLRALKRALGDWALAAAAYNAGSGRITRGMQYFRVDNFWDLAQHGDLAAETRHYVPRLYAMTIIARSRERFGFRPAASAPAFAFDSIQVEYATPVEEIARLGDVSVEQLLRLNPHLLRRATPAGGYWVWVPAGTGPTLQRAWLASDFRRDQGYGSYAVRRGDTLGRLAELSGVRSERIRELNPGRKWENLQVGEPLRLPARAARALSARPAVSEEKTRLAVREAAPERAGKPGKAVKPEPSDKADRAAGSEGEAAVHAVKPGETLWSIARRYEVEVSALQAANGLSGSTIVPGRELRIPRPAARQANAAPAPARAARAAKHAEAGDRHVVRDGESLWGIARRYGSTVEAIQGANDLGERALQPGMTLTIPSSR